MSVLLPGQLFPRTSYFCIYSCLSWCAKTTHLLVCIQCHRGTSCAPVQSARRPWCASEGPTMRTFLSTTFVLRPPAEISVRRCLSLGWYCVVPRSWTGATRSMRSFSGCRGASPANSVCPLGWYTAVGLYTMEGISVKVRELAHYDHGASAVNQALHGTQDSFQGPHVITFLYRYLHALQHLPSHVCVRVYLCVCACVCE